MKILLVSFHFPPHAPLGARRPSKLAKHLLAAGWDLRVLCAAESQSSEGPHDLEIDPWRVFRTDWTDWRLLPDRALAKVFGASAPSSAAASGHGAPPPTRKSLRKRARAFARRSYELAFCLPDGKRGWRPAALKAGESIFRGWRPDVIYVSAPPHSSISLARDLARLAGDVPWGLEFRDRWAGDSYADHPAWRRALDRRMERRLMEEASLIGAVSPLWAEELGRIYGPDKVVLSMNGFDPEDQPLDVGRPDLQPQGLYLLYAGAIYPGRRDMAPVLEALARLTPEEQKAIRLDLYGDPRLQAAAEEAKARGLQIRAEAHPSISHAEIVARQYAADVNLLLGWNDPREGGTIPGKLFELIAARRPALATGWPEGAAGRLVRERGLGLVSTDPEEIAHWLRGLLARKRAEGASPILPAAIRDGLSRAEQFAPIEARLRRIVEARAAAAEAQRAAPPLGLPAE